MEKERAYLGIYEKGKGDDMVLLAIISAPILGASANRVWFNQAELQAGGDEGGMGIVSQWEVQVPNGGMKGYRVLNYKIRIPWEQNVTVTRMVPADAELMLAVEGVDVYTDGQLVW